MAKGSVVAGNGAALDTVPEAPATGSAGAVLRRRRALPGSRALVGALLVAASAVGLFAAYEEAGEGPRHSYVVARHALSPGARLEASDLVLQAMELPSGLRARVFDDRRRLVGATVIAPLAAGELVQASAVVASGGEDAHREVTFTVERGHLAAEAKEGERVDVLATYGTGSEAFTEVVVRNALIVGMERPRTSIGEGAGAVVTVGLTAPDEVLAMAHASQLAKITLVRATGAPPLPPGPDSYRTDSQAR